MYLQCLLNGRLVVPSVNLVQIDVVRTEALQRRVARRQNVFSRKALLVWEFRIRNIEEALCGDHNLISLRAALRDRATGDLLTH